MKKLFLILIFIGTVFAGNNDFLNPEDAFKVTVSKKQNSIEFKIQLDKSIYIYDEFLEIAIIKPSNIDITKELTKPKPVEYHEAKVHFGELIVNIPLKLIEAKIGQGDFELKLYYQGCSKKGLCYSPMSKIYSSSVEVASKNIVNETDSITQTLQTGSLLLVLITFFGFGLLLSLTPCIFPMIPILSSIIVHHTKKHEKMSTAKGFFLSLVYVLSMSITYTIAGILAGLFGANIQAMLQNPFVIIGFALVFVALAFSMFGYYEIALPQSWQSKLNKTSDENSKGDGIIGIAIMGFLSALIVGPCVAPPLAGALVYIGQTGDAVLGGLALFIMSLGMGMPLLLIGAGSAKFMPKPGGWMTTVSKVFGVVMLAIAIWMLDKIVPEIVTLNLFSLLCIGSAFYLVRYGNNLGKLTAGILLIVSIIFTYNGLTINDNDKSQFKYVKTVQELEQIVSRSKKPIMIDFWATWCTSCKEFDKITFQDETIKKELKKYILLKVDVTKNSKDDKTLMDKFNLFGPPAMIFYKNGKEEKQKRIIGYKDAKEFLEIIK